MTSVPASKDEIAAARALEKPEAERGAETAEAAIDEARIPLPQSPRSALLAGIFVLMVFYTLYFAREIVMPILFAFLLNLLMQPGMRLLARLRIPAVISAILMIVLFLALMTGLTSSLAAPAAHWFGQLPQTLPRIEERLSVLRGPVAEVQHALEELSRLAGPANSGATPVVVQGSGLGGVVFTSTTSFLGGVLTMIVVLFFLLSAGDLFLRKLVEVLPRFGDKKHAVAISQEVEEHISAYLVTISGMNLLVGIGVGLSAWIGGLGDPLLWGVMAFLLNYVPVIGPMAGIVLVFLGGMLTFDALWKAVLLAGVYLGIHLLEGEVVTPMLVARRFTLNPVLVIISLIFWFWLWGVPGAVIAVPLLATVKIICDHVRPLMAIGHFIGG
ncbi:MAG TPA: AI-2E family transporter [Stellaceae bacterium]|nr:AI-2E family transporter [Stellaceae bacterium]